MLFRSAGTSVSVYDHESARYARDQAGIADRLWMGIGTSDPENKSADFVISKHANHETAKDFLEEDHFDAT